MTEERVKFRAIVTKRLHDKLKELGADNFVDERLELFESIIDNTELLLYEPTMTDKLIIKYLEFNESKN